MGGLFPLPPRGRIRIRRIDGIAEAFVCFAVGINHPLANKVLVMGAGRATHGRAVSLLVP